MPEPTKKSPQRYTAPVRRGFGHLVHIFATASQQPNSIVAAYFRDLDPVPQNDVQLAIDYMTEQFQDEIAKYSVPSFAPITQPTAQQITDALLNPSTPKLPAPDGPDGSRENDNPAYGT